MVPPLKDVVALLLRHPAFALPTDAETAAALRNRVVPLQDMQFARTRRAIHCPKACKGTVQEHRTTDPRGAIRIYFTLVDGKAVLLLWGDKASQDDDIRKACDLAHDLRARPALTLAGCVPFA